MRKGQAGGGNGRSASNGQGQRVELTGVAYRGYLISLNQLNGLRWIEKDGRRIAYCASEAEGRRIVDQLLD